jgi:hypothetical protein
MRHQSYCQADGRLHSAVRGLGRRGLSLPQIRRAMHRKPPHDRGVACRDRHGDTAYDADHSRYAIAAKSVTAVIPNNPSRALKYPLDKLLNVHHHLVECCF